MPEHTIPESLVEAIKAGREGDELAAYEEELRTGPIAKDLKKVRNVKPMWSRWGLLASLTFGGFDMWTNNLFGLSLFGTLRHGKSDAKATGKAKDFAKKWALNRRFEPGMGDKERRAKIKGWRDAVRRTLSSG